MASKVIVEEYAEHVGGVPLGEPSAVTAITTDTLTAASRVFGAGARLVIATVDAAPHRMVLGRSGSVTAGASDVRIVAGGSRSFILPPGHDMALSVLETT